ncbi:MAG: hypothetical protein RL685_5318 [Pseudomonadota bacterium]|jgi:predicted ATPase/GAF domain-containing protein/tRNA A-37 threonylcarbamoyl transferase component Bud32/HPt (histidine-containing phosphotransfer) domain-containing protein
MSLPGYEIQSTIARSEHHVLERALRLADGRSVILKRLAQTYAALSVQRRLELEYRLLSRLNVPGVVRALELIDAGGRPVLVLEDFGAESLALRPGEALELDRFFDVALQATRALGEIHAHGLIHKDIKPRNLVLNRQTGVLKIIDFQLATELTRESQDIEAAGRLEGSLPYISPEQTGRMNRCLDYRTDYYSLGVTFFELLSGRLPFEASDVMGWVHAHLSRPPIDLATISATPPALCALIRKLMAKSPDARYQSSRGLVADLERCRERWRAAGEIPPFELGQADVSERFRVSERLIGREHEVRTLLESFTRASEGSARLLLVSGYSGVGKSSLIREVYKPITERKGNFLSGKFDQLDRNVPYGAVVQAVRQLVRQLLGSPEAELRTWKERLIQALGPNAQVMIDLIPELGTVLGPQSTVADLNASEALHRFKRVFGRFIQVFARSDQPLVMFLDDLQWTDASTPELLADLLAAQDVRHLLVIAAYRDNEVTEGHLLPVAVRRIRDSRPDAVQEIHLEPLALASVTELCADSLRRPAGECQPLGDLIFNKTAGNPFFASELLAQLHRLGAISLNVSGGWDYDLRAAARASVSRNVLELMLARMADLPSSSKTALCTAACMSNQFDLSTLAHLLGQAPSETARALWEPIARGLIEPRGDGYRLAQRTEVPLSSEASRELAIGYQFQHDRVQQAAYSLMKPEERVALHLQLGRRLLLDQDEAQIKERVFDIVNHLNLGSALVTDLDERELLVRLNLQAGVRASQSTAYAVASTYLDTAIELLGPEGWASRPDDRFELHARRVECVLMAGDSSRAALLCHELTPLAPSRVARGAVYLLEARILEAQARFVEAVDAIRAGLALFGITLPADPEQIGQGIGAGIGRMQGHLAQIPPEQLLQLPDLTDPDEMMAMNLLFQSIPSAIQTCPPLFILAELTMFDLAVKHGLAPVSAKNFVDCGIIQGGILGDYDTAYRLGKVAFQVLDRFDAKAIASGVNFVFAAYVSSWRAPHQEALEAFRECYRVGMETGDIQHMGFGTALRLHRLLHLGHELQDCEAELAPAIAFLERSNLPSQRTAVVLVERALARLCNADASAERSASEDALATTRVLDSRNPQWIYAYAESQMMVSILLGDFEIAERWRQMAEPHVLSATALISIPEYHLGEALILTQHAWPAADAARRVEILGTVRQIRDKLESWSSHCASNFAHKFHLVAAELARIEGGELPVVLRHYQQAAHTTGSAYIQMRALALELQARFWRDQDNAVFSRALLLEALELYQRWGARTKARRLAQQCSDGATAHSAVETALRQTSSSHTYAAARDVLDLASVVKATQVLSSEVRSDQLFESLMSTLIENAAAQCGSLILCHDTTGQLTIEAQASVDGRPRVSSQPLASAGQVCVALVQLAIRSREAVVSDDAGADDRFSNDPYVREHGVKSVLCLPIVNQGRLVAAFYAENNLTTHAFPPHRMATLRLIAGQAAISIVNAQLYANLELKVEERTRELAGKNREIVAMLDGMEQGVFSIDAELRIQPQYSRHLPTIMGTDELAGQPFAPLLFAGSDVGADARSAAEMAVQFSFGVTPMLANLNLGHLVREFSRPGATGTGSHFEISWHLITGSAGTVEKFLVVVRDVTLLRQLREAHTQAAWEAETVTQILLAGVDEFRGFCESTRAFLQADLGLANAGRELTEQDGQQVFRGLHTIKGNARALGLGRLVEQVHDVEELLDRHDGNARPIDWAALFRALESVEAKLAAHEQVGQRKLGQLWTGESERLERAIEEIEAALDGARSNPSRRAPALAAIEQTVRQIQSVPLGTLLRDATRFVPSLATELGKATPRLEWHDANVSLDPSWARILKGVLTHTLRNSLDHGIESALERVAHGKPPQGEIRLSAERLPSGLRLRLSDDGRGLDLKRLRARSSQAPATDEVLGETIFKSGVTTADSVTLASGRGVGMDAVRQFVQDGGGSVRICFTGEESAGYRPFELVLELPAHAILEQSPTTSAAQEGRGQLTPTSPGSAPG